MTEREQFEAWASDQMRFPAAIQRDGSGYRLQVTQLYWLAWQARAALAQPVAAEPEQDTDPFDDRKDAERYRWLREEAQYFSIGRAPAVVLCDEHDLLEKGKTPCEPDGWGFISGSRLDAAIDAARAPTPA